MNSLPLNFCDPF